MIEFNIIDCYHLRVGEVYRHLQQPIKEKALQQNYFFFCLFLRPFNLLISFTLKFFSMRENEGGKIIRNLRLTRQCDDNNFQ
jgi:hypothetical protein